MFDWFSDAKWIGKASVENTSARLVILFLLAICGTWKLVIWHARKKRRQEKIFFSALESGRPDFKKSGQPLLGPRTSNRGPKEKIKERKRASHHTPTHHKSKPHKPEGDKSLSTRISGLATSFDSASIAAAINGTSSPRTTRWLMRSIAAA